MTDRSTEVLDKDELAGIVAGLEDIETSRMRSLAEIRRELEEDADDMDTED